jgi:hypothetical protein
MPKVSDIFGSQYLRAADLTTPLVVVIEGWNSEVLFKEEVYVLTFRDQAFKLKLTQSNAHDLARLFGDDIDGWVDHAVELYSVSIEIQDQKSGLPKMIDIIRARASTRPPGGNSQPQAAAPIVPAKSAARDAELDDEIPVLESTPCAAPALQMRSCEPLRAKA